MSRLGLALQAGLPLMAVFIAALLSSVAGFAFSALCGALLFHLFNAPVEIVRVLLLCSIANQALSVFMLRRDIVWQRLLPFLVTGGLGVPVGVFALLHSTPHTYLRGFGCLLVAYSAYRLIRPAAGAASSGRPGDWVAGFVGGITGGGAAFPGARVMVWVARRGWSKSEQRAVFQPFILACLTLLVRTASLGHNSGAAGIAPSLLAYLPTSVLGTWCGLAVFRRLTDRQFGSVTNMFLIVSGIGLIV